DNVVTSLLVVEGNGVVSEHAGGYSDWLARAGRLVEGGGQGERAGAPVAPIAREAPAPAAAPAPKKKKLSYKEQRELAAMPGLIETLEQRQQALEATMAEPDFYQREPGQAQEVIAQLASVQAELEAAFARWAELDG
ncbi:MAG: ABC transporter ATP-binding protein, partial [Halioglobus sp.]